MCLRRSSRKDPLGEGLAESYQSEVQAGGNEPQYRAGFVRCKGVSTSLVENVDTRGSGGGIKVQRPASPNIENDHRAIPLLAPKRRLGEEPSSSPANLTRPNGQKCPGGSSRLWRSRTRIQSLDSQGTAHRQPGCCGKGFDESRTPSCQPPRATMTSSVVGNVLNTIQGPY